MEEKETGTINRQGNWMVDSFWMMRDTGYYYRKLGDDWLKYSTWQDADYFGAWVNFKTMQVLTFAEGDESLVSCLNPVRFNLELRAMDACYKE